MKSKRTLIALFFAAVFTLFSASASFAQDAMKKDDGMKKDDAMMKDDGMKHEGMMKEDTRPIVAIVKADWCPYCKRIDPVVSGLMKDYSEKLHFVVFDVTDEKTIAASKEHADKLGMSKFFDEYKGKTSSVAVLKDKKILYKTSNNGEREDYVKAFEKALK
ncbi:MAG: thioredoxin family protein [Acidobacteria bacterium]|nr:thioredoxin family protein [Acidobacteriota bacterium]